MTLNNRFATALANKDYNGLIHLIPYAKLIGVECIPIGDAVIFSLPKNDDNIGNPTLPAIHGGVLAGFVETAAILHVMMSTRMEHIPKIVDFSIDYLRAGRHCDSFAQCDVVRLGRKVVNVSISVWQTTKDKPIALARTHMLLRSD